MSNSASDSSPNLHHLAPSDFLHRFLILILPVDIRIWHWDANGIIGTKPMDHSELHTTILHILHLDKNTQSLPQRCTKFEMQHVGESRDLYFLGLARSQAQMYPSVDPVTQKKALLWMHAKAQDPDPALTQKEAFADVMSAPPSPRQIRAIEGMLTMLYIRLDLNEEVSVLGCTLALTSGDASKVVLAYRRIKAGQTWYRVLQPLMQQRATVTRRKLERRHLYSPGDALRTFRSPQQLLQAVHASYMGHKFAYKRHGLLHGNISDVTLRLVQPDSGFLIG